MNNEIDPVRSATMRAVKSKHTGPELLVRRLIHHLGYRFRLHREHLPGKPDIVFPSRRKVIFVHGCFWHGHCCARGNRQPKTNADYWSNKIARNQARHAAAVASLKKMKWDVLTVWECQLLDETTLSERIEHFLSV